MTGEPAAAPLDVSVGVSAPPGRASREYRATVALLVTGVFLLLVVALYQGTISSIPVIRTVTLAGPVIAAILQLVVAFGLASRARWARVAMTPALWVVGLSGGLTFLVSLTRGGIDIPIGALLAIWALRAPPEHRPGEGIGQRQGSVLATIVVAAMALMAGWPLIAQSATQAGGPLIAAATDLRLEFQPSATCPDGLPAHGPPETIDVVLRWTWARGEPIRAGTDAVVFTWATMSGPEGSGGYYLDQPIEQQPGITEEDRSARFAVYRIDLAERGLAPGSASIRLRRPNELETGPGMVEIAASYAHHYLGLAGQRPTGVWIRAEAVSCGW